MRTVLVRGWLGADGDCDSSDLWVVDTQVPGATNTSKSAKVTYAIGAAEGPILLADLEFAGYNVSQQAFCKPLTAFLCICSVI